MSIALIDSSHIAIVYADRGRYNAATAVIGIINGSSIAFGSRYELSERGQELYNTIAAIDPNHVAIGYFNKWDQLAVKIGVISNNSIACGVENLISGAPYVRPISVFKIDPSHIVVAYSGNNNTGVAVIGSISGDTITYSSGYMFSNVTGGNKKSITLLDTNHIAIAYNNSSQNGSNGAVVIGTISGNTIAFGPEYIYTNVPALYGNILSIDSDQIVTAMSSGNSSNYYAAARIFTTKTVTGVGTLWNTSWPANAYQIKFGTNSLTGIGNPDTWFNVEEFISPSELKLNEMPTNGFLPAGTPYIIRMPY